MVETRLLRGGGPVPLWIQKVAFHHRKRIHDFAFLMHWMSGTLPLHGGQITEWIPIISSALGVHMEMLDHAPTLPHAHQEGHHVPSRTCLVRLLFRDHGVPSVQDTFRFCSLRIASRRAAAAHLLPRRVARPWCAQRGRHRIVWPPEEPPPPPLRHRCAPCT